MGACLRNSNLPGRREAVYGSDGAWGATDQGAQRAGEHVGDGPDLIKRGIVAQMGGERQHRFRIRSKHASHTTTVRIATPNTEG